MESIKKAMPTRVQVAAILKKALFSGEYKSGDELSLTVVAERLGVSRTPVREAFQTLEAEGLIELRMNKGAIVRPIDEKYITDHYELRSLLESEAARRAAVRGMPDTAELLEKVRSLQTRLESVSAEEYETLNFAIHSAIWTAADNDRMYKMLSAQWNGPSVGVAVPELDHYIKSTQEHISILEAIARRDAQTAQKEMTGHIERSLDNILRNFKYR